MSERWWRRELSHLANHGGRSPNKTRVRGKGGTEVYQVQMTTATTKNSHRDNLIAELEQQKAARKSTK